jgi:hypothetical protein
LFKSDDKNDLKLIELKINSYDMKTNKSIHNKIRIIRNVEDKYKLGFMNVAFEKQEEWINFDDKLYELIKVVFVTKTIARQLEKPKDALCNDVKESHECQVYHTETKFIA